jgi:hypothetical protein
MGISTDEVFSVLNRIIKERTTVTKGAKAK